MSQSPSEPTTDNSDELSIKDLIGKVKSAIKYLKSQWLIISICSIVGAGIGFIYAVIKKPTYKAVSKFVLEENDKSLGLGQYANLASLAGIDVGGSGGGIFQGDNIIELYKSRTMIEETLLSKATFNGKQQLLIDRYIEFNKLRDEWKQKKTINNVDFTGDFKQFNRLQDSIITDIVQTFNRQFLAVAKPDKKLSIISVEFVSKDELFAKEFTNKLVETVNNFYVETKTKKAVQNVQILQRQADSVRTILNSAITGVASAMDAAPNANPALLVLRVPSQKRQIDVQSSSSLYAEIIKNLELSKITLRLEQPLIQVIDAPILPLDVTRLGKIKGGVLGAFIFGFVSVVVLIVKKLYNIIIK